MSSYFYQPWKQNPRNLGWGAALSKRRPTIWKPPNAGWNAGSSTVAHPAAAAAVVQPKSPAAATGYRPPTYSWMNDPALLAAKTNAGKSKADAAADRDDQWRKITLQTGVSQLAEKLFPKDAAFIASVKNNPFSSMQEIANTYEGRSGLINSANEDLNKAGLWFSSERTGNVLPQLYRQRGSDEYGITTQAQNATDEVNRAFTSRVAQIEWEMQQAELLAMQNQLLRELQNPSGGPSGNDGTGTPPGTGTGNDGGTGGQPARPAGVPANAKYAPPAGGQAGFYYWTDSSGFHSVQVG